MGFMTLDEAKVAQEAGLAEARASVPLYDESNINVISPGDTGAAGAPDYDDSVAAIEAWVASHPDDAQRYLDAEEAKTDSKRRTTLVDSLKAITDSQE